jgi:hypothetical protein
MDLDHVALAVVKVIQVTTGLSHQPALDQLASVPPVALTCRRRGAQMAERLLELLDQKILRVSMLTPPGIFCFELPLSLIK